MYWEGCMGDGARDEGVGEWGVEGTTASNLFCVPRFRASPPSPLEFGTFLKSAELEPKVIFDGLAKISLERGCKTCGGAVFLNHASCKSVWSSIISYMRVVKNEVDYF
jgi:hypothetical protein